MWAPILADARAFGTGFRAGSSQNEWQMRLDNFIITDIDNTAFIIATIVVTATKLIINIIIAVINSISGAST